MEGTIYSGTEEEMNEIWHNTLYTFDTLPRVQAWKGDLKLIQIHAIHK